MLDLLIRLNLIRILKFNLKDKIDTSFKYSHIIKVLLNILKFDRMNKAIVKAYENSYNRHIKEKLKNKS